MAALIRSAPLADGRRLLRRPAAPQAAAAAVPAPAVAAAPPVHEEIERVRQEVERRLADGKRELERERAAMRAALEREQAAALDKAAERGRQEGEQRGEAQGRAALEAEAARLRGIADALQAARQAMFDDAEDAMVEVVFTAVARMVGNPAGGRAAALHAVRQAAQAVRAGDVLDVLVHPDDLAVLGQHVGMPANVRLAPGDAVALGGCLIDSATGTLDARLETQLARLRAALVDARAAREAGGPA